MRVCSVHGCPEIYPQAEGTRCRTHRAIADRGRGDRGYSSKAHRTFRTIVIQRDPVCVLCHLRPSSIADHYPRSRKELIDHSLNPNDPECGRGLCKNCHDSWTAQAQPGGWNAN